MNDKRAFKIKRLERGDNKCFWCGRIVKDYGYIGDGITQPDDQATIDHLKSRFFRHKGEVVEKVLACYRCNQNRAIEEDKKYGVGLKRYPHNILI